MFTVFLDESGDHNLSVIDPQYPVFSLAGVIVRDADLPKLDSGLTQIKDKYWLGVPPEEIVFRSRLIRKQEHHFAILRNETTRNEFMTDLDEYMRSSPYILIGSVIDKQAHISRYAYPENPYNLTPIYYGEGTSFVCTHKIRKYQSCR